MVEQARAVDKVEAAPVQLSTEVVHQPNAFELEIHSVVVLDRLQFLQAVTDRVNRQNFFGAPSAHQNRDQTFHAPHVEAGHARQITLPEHKARKHREVCGVNAFRYETREQFDGVVPPAFEEVAAG